MVRVVGVRFKAAGKVYYFDPAEYPIAMGERVVVETARGVEYGEVAIGPKEVAEEQVVQPLKKVLRVGTEKDAVLASENKRKEQDAFVIAQKKIEAHGLEMSLVDVEYTFDGSKVIFYFTAEGRIDFRELVRDLASVFRTRIEMRQIGVRDEAKMLGGLGPCGRILCCTSFLGDFAPVSIRMAKDQNLSLNPTKISGLCGRLMCCLRYEQDTYEAAKKDPTLAPGYMPPVVPADEPLPEWARLEDTPAPRPRRESVGFSARIAQAAGLASEPEAASERLEERPVERRSDERQPRERRNLQSAPKERLHSKPASPEKSLQASGPIPLERVQAGDGEPAGGEGVSGTGKRRRHRSRHRRGSEQAAGGAVPEMAGNEAPVEKRVGDRPHGERRPQLARPERADVAGSGSERLQASDRLPGERLSGERFQGDRSQGNRSQGDHQRSERSHREQRPQGERNRSDRPRADRAQGERPQPERTPNDGVRAEASQSATVQGESAGAGRRRRHRRGGRRHNGDQSGGNAEVGGE